MRQVPGGANNQREGTGTGEATAKHGADLGHIARPRGQQPGEALRGQPMDGCQKVDRSSADTGSDVWDLQNHL